MGAMAEDREDDSLHDEALDRDFKDSFAARAVQWDEGVIDAIKEGAGIQPSVVLRDAEGESAPIIKVRPIDESRRSEDSRYEIVGEIARGGVGVVHKSRDKDLGRDVATKVLRDEYAADPDIVERFLEEAQIEGQLQHPGIVPVYDLGLEPDGRPYFVMKLIKGRTLSALLADRESPASDRRRFLSIFEQICQTMAYAHARGVIHRDLKSANVMIGAFGEVQLVDWGFAKVLGRPEKERQQPADRTVIVTRRSGEDGSQSVAGSVMGTPAYMPPEQAYGRIDELDERSDVFGLGAILCETLTGKPPYVGEHRELLAMAAQARLRGARERLSACGADDEIVSLCLQCLAPTMSERPHHAGALASSIGAYLAAMEERARKAEVDAAAQRAQEEQQQLELENERAKAAWAHRARRRTRVWAAALIAAVLLAGGWYLWTDRMAAERAGRTAEAVGRSLADAKLFAGRKRWTEAIGAAETADQLARGEDGDGDTRARARAVLVALRAEKQRALDAQAQERRDAAFLARQAELLAGTARIPITADHATAFEAYGVPLDRRSEQDAIAALKGSAIAVELAAALNDWALRRGRGGEKLARIALAIDPDPWRTRLRKAMGEGDRAAVKALTESVGDAKLSADSAALLGQTLLHDGEYAAAAALVEVAERDALDDVRLLLIGAEAERMRVPPRWKAVARYLTAAATLRPDSARVMLHLGDALMYSGDVAAAVSIFEHGHKSDSKRAAITVTLKRLVARLPALNSAMSGESEFGTQDHVDLARLLFYKQRYGAAANHYAVALEERRAHLFFAAASAALAGTGAGDDAAGLDEAARAKWRAWALKWIRLALEDRKRGMQSDIAATRREARRSLEIWKTAWFFECVRLEPALSKLPAEEQEAWRGFWKAVDTALAGAK